MGIRGLLLLVFLTTPAAAQSRISDTAGERIPAGTPSSWYEIVAYGADPKGAADSTNAIQKAIDAANAGHGGVVHVPAGTFLISSTLALKQYVTLQGDGMGASILKATAPIDMIAIDGTASHNQIVAIRDMYLDANRVATRCIHLRNAVSADFHRVFLNGGTTESALLTSTADAGTYHIQFRQCWIGNGAVGIHASGLWVTGLVLSDCEIGGTGGGIVADSTSGYDITANACVFESSGAPGVRVEGSSTPGAALAMAVTDCYFESNKISDIDINPSGVTPSLPSVSVKGGETYGTPIGIRMNPNTALLQVTGLRSGGHATADISLGDLSTTRAAISIVGNNLASPTKISSSNPSTPGTTYPFGPLVYSQITDAAPIRDTETPTSFDRAYTIPANSLRPGSVLRVTGSGAYSATGTPTLKILPRVAGRSIASWFLRTGDALTDRHWSFTAIVVLRSAGPHGTMEIGASTISAAGSGAATSAAHDGDAAGSFTFDTTAPQVVDVQVTWGAAAPSNSITLHTLTVEILPPAATQ